MNSKFIFLGFILLCLHSKSSIFAQTPLDDYVNAPDSNYKYELIKTYKEPLFTFYVLNMTSQKWTNAKNESYTVQPIWWHFMTITVPDRITRPGVSFLLIDSGSNLDKIPAPGDYYNINLPVMVGVSTGMISAAIRQVPNQPIVFKNDPSKKVRTEDAILAWTWASFMMDPTDAYVLHVMPMTKAAVRAMDTVQDFVNKKGFPAVEKFVVAGASKRGWATWTTMATASTRIIAAVPIVMDLLNLNQGMHSHFRALGGWTFAFKDYWATNITKQLGSTDFLAMAKIMDPATYYDRYMNKNIMLIQTSGDEFFLPQDTRNFWNDIVAATDGSVLMRRMPNADHGFKGHEISVFFSLRSFVLSNYEKQALPKVIWSFSNNITHGVIDVNIDITNGRPKPLTANIYYAKTLDNKRVDFRMIIGNPINSSEPYLHPVPWLRTDKDLVKTETSTSIRYKASMLRPLRNSGWFGFFVEFSFAGLESSVLPVTTETNIIPETFPVPDCFMETCYGNLV